MKNRALLFPTLAAALMLGAPSSPAQDAGPGPDAVISIDFGGGSLTDLIEAIRGAGQNINILIPPDADEVAVPGLSLKEVSVESALRAISDVASNEMINVGMSVQRAGRGEPVFALRVDLNRNLGPRPEARMVEVYSIKSLTEAMPGDPEAARITVSSETILTAIDTGLEVSASGAEQPVVRYHEDSGLLFVRATVRQHGLINDIIRNMSADLERRRGAARASSGQSGGRGGRQDR